ncbi:esterase [Jannaschia pagri]|uniref:Esterase n=1 Tax=Jannaschia pagri TaxID=2829797 RepID=A0ABQ4NKC6_9RHOB|nr:MULTISPECIES: alpha/beta hydrolase fold domain-containing protein [unclassified Jannaschia]GIT91015.1 esterase [Jannaschia sp. AI_61]GIT94847.1 esterase [Jannaschia sp. AI_62]
MDGWQNMDRGALDDAYANADYIPDAASFPPRWASDAAAFRAAVPGKLDVPYAEGSGAAFDLFHPAVPPQGLMVFVHGGYWRRFGKSDWSHFAAGGLAAGLAVAVVGYPLAPTVRIAEITRHVRSAVEAAATRVGGSIHLTGHSAGGHLVARLLMADAKPNCTDRIATCVPISPVADLRPLVRQTMNEDLRLDAASADSESPVLAQPVLRARAAVYVGAEERPSFLWQAQALGEAWSIPVHQVAERHHFNVIDDLRSPDTSLMAAVLGSAG